MIGCYIFLLVYQTVIIGNADGSMLRLTGGVDKFEGRLEIKINDDSSWGNVCDDGFNSTEATVVCRQLGLSLGGTFVPTYRGGSLPIVLDDVQCTGTEKDIMDCTHSTHHNCDHGEDVGVKCDKTKRPSNVKLSGGTEGLLEVFTNGTEFAVCNNVTSAVSSVVCTSLGLSSYGFTATSYMTKNKRFLDGISCKGNATIIEDCKYIPASSNVCKLGFAVIKCLQVRLSYGSSVDEGRLEVTYDKKWGNVCDYGFTNREASVVCRMLGLSWNGRFSSEFKNGNLPFILDKVKCRGTEGTLLECRHNAWNKYNCDHNQDVGIECLPSMYLSLVGGSSPEEGIPEIQLGKYQAHICSHEFDSRDALVFCRELGFHNVSNVAVVPGRMYTSPARHLLQETFHCNGNETKLVHCIRIKTSCPLNHRTAIICDPREPEIILKIPSPMIKNVTINLTCTAIGGQPHPRIRWDCNGIIRPTTISVFQHNLTSALSLKPTKSFNGQTCTCYALQEETTFPIIVRSEILTVYYPVPDDLIVEVPILTHQHHGNLTCEASDGNPPPVITWNCTGIPDNNLKTTSETGKTTLHIMADKEFNGESCSCYVQQLDTNFEPLMETVSLNILYAVSSKISLITTDLVDGQFGYVICRVIDGNPKPMVRISCTGVSQPSNQIQLTRDTISVLSFQAILNLDGTKCTCFVHQTNSEFEAIERSTVLHVSPKA